MSLSARSNGRDYGLWSVLKGGLTGQRHWKTAWAKADPKPAYDIVVIGGGGHGLATAYYLAKQHREKRVAVVEKGWIGGGNAGRNTTIVRSNYMLPGNREFYEHSLRLWENLSHELNMNVMFSQRAHLALVTSPGQRDAMARRYNVMRLTGSDGEWWDRRTLSERVPSLCLDGRWEILGAFVQPRAGTARHDAVNWGFARGASARGVDIIENCEVTGFRRDAGRIVGIETTRGEIRAERIAIAVAGNSSRVAAMMDMRLPIETHKLQAFVSEPIKPFLDQVVTIGSSAHYYISQSDKGGMVFGGPLDYYPSYAQRGNLPVYRDVIESCVNLMPALGRVKLLRQWAGVMDMSPDGSPFITATDEDGVFLNAGWCYGGFKATPGSGHVFAHLIATGRPHDAAAKLTLSRYCEGRQIDETGVGPTPKWH
ncbi:MAG: sarcosine oxidase subunit beta family protein [Pseudomonadota bacterium]